MRVTRLVTVLGVGALCARCLVVSPLDDVNDGVGTGGTGGIAGSSGTDAGGGSAGASGSAGGSCTAHLDCAQETSGEPARCVKGKCEAIKTNECWCVPNVSSDVWTDPNSILIGAFAPLASDANGCGSDTASRNYRLALEELNDLKHGGGLPGPGAVRRPLAVVLCDNGEQLADPKEREARVLAGTNHLTQTLKVPAVLAYVDTGDLQKAFAQAQLEGVFFLTPSGATQSLADEDDDRLLWHMLGFAGDIAPTYAALVKLLEPLAPVTLNKGGPLRVLMLAESGAFQTDLRVAVESLVQFNGKSVALNQGDDNYKTVFVDPTDPTKTPALAGEEIILWQPHIVISTIGISLNAVQFKADENWRPYYILSPLNLALLDPLFKQIEDTNQEVAGVENKLQERFVGVNIAGSEETELLASYQKRLVDRFGPTANTIAENVYDSVYYLAYAMLAGGTPDSVFGGDIPQGMDAILVQGTQFEVGPAHIASVFSELQKSSGQMRLFGTMGPPQYFDRETGVRHNTGSLYCLQRSNTTGDISAKFHVGHYDDLANPAHLRLAKQYQGATTTCLDWLNLPES